MTKLDLRKELKYLYSPSAKKVEAVKVPRFQFAMADGMIEKGEGPSSSPQFAEALEALFCLTSPIWAVLWRPAAAAGSRYQGQGPSLSSKVVLAGLRHRYM